MLKRTLALGVLVAATVLIGMSGSASAQKPGQPNDWQRFYYYPYVYYPHNFQQYPESNDSLYQRYPKERQIPIYNSNWYNFYPSAKPYHRGNHYKLDVF
ncbi:MAG: hypothetical protein R3C01_16820 [Planctomycetaceae bacterium]